ncbi:MAG TPA: alpha/beta hydrolase [Xanthobacteraceae bacterium]|nr:alpha/beta hydrolase [Xanthobacteraceae bacterium]
MVPSPADQGFALPADPRDKWASLDAATRDAAYNNNAAAADSPKWIEKRNNDSAAYRSAHPRCLDIAYAPAERTAFDLFPAPDAAAPCLVFIHGGYWQRNSRQDFACFAQGLAAAGWSVAIPGYTLAPQANIGKIVAEIGQALDWLADHGARHGIAGPLIIAGWSAGAQLAALHLQHPRVVGGLAISGIYDLAPLRDTNLNQALNLSDDEIAAFSPLRRPAVQKPLVISFGGAELPTLVHDAYRFHELRHRAGAPGELLPIAHADHFSILRELQEPDGALVRAAVDLVEE